jgi:large subunit ribosomal protein L22
MKTFVKNYRQSPRKVRLVADLVRGKSVPNALTALTFLDKTAALPMKKALESAVANAVNLGKKAENLVISKITVDKGTVMTKFMPRARGSASPINRRSSHIAIQLSEK